MFVVALLAVAALPVPASAQPSPDDFDFAIADAEGYPRTKGGGDTVSFSGTVPDGQITSAVLIGDEQDGTRVTQTITGRDSSRDNYVVNDGGTLSGQAILNSCFNEPGSFCPEPTSGVTHITLQLTIAGTTAASRNRLVNDYTPPQIIRFDIVESDEIVAVFSEPVRLPEQLLEFDRAADWDVNDPDLRVLRVTNDGAPAGSFGSATNVYHPTRRVFTETIPEDATPHVTYFADFDLGRGYADQAGNNLNGSTLQTGNGDAAIDNVRPIIPTIEAIGGVSPTDGRATSRSQSPVIEVSGINGDSGAAGTQTLSLYVDNNLVVDDIAFDDDTTTVQAPSLGVDDLYAVEVAAVDASGNTTWSGSPDREGKSTPSPGDPDDPNNPVDYVLDTVPPVALSAARTSNVDEVLVTFRRPPNLAEGQDEPVQADAGTWTVAGQTGTATTTDTPLQRLVTFPGAIPQTDTVITWAPDGDPYTDAVGNPMTAITNGLPIQPPPPVLPPVFLDPVASGPRFVNTTSYTVAVGLPSEQDVDEVNDVIIGILGDEGTRESATRDGATWSSDVDLPSDGPYRFEAQTRSVFGAQSTWRTSVEIVRDATAPVPTLVTPAEPGGLFGGGGTETAPGPNQVEFWVDEDNFSHAVVTVTYDDGTVEEYTYDKANTGSADNPVVQDIEIPADYIGEVTVTVRAIDLAGNEATSDEGLFDVIDAILGVGTLETNAVGLNATRIPVVFEGPLTGSTNGGDWSATNGLTGDGSRNPTSTNVNGDTVTLSFSQPFPGGLTSSVDNNATPRLTFSEGLFTSLEGADGREVLVAPVVRDVIPPAAPTTSPVTGSPAKLDEAQPADGVDCDQEPDAEGCPYVATFTGTTGASARPNLFTVHRNADGQPGAVILPAREASTDGSFRFQLPVTPNDTTSVVVTVEDPAGNPAATFAVAEIVEDSLGPDVVSLVASLDGADVVQVEFEVRDAAAGEDQGANVAALSYRVGGGDFELIQDGLDVDADGTGSFRWTVPEDVDLTEGGLQMRLVATDPLGNVGPPSTTGISNVPRIVSATALDLRTVRVTTSEPVTTDQPDGAGFRILSGPGVTDATVGADGRIVLDLNNDLPTGEQLFVAYNGRGEWATADGRLLGRGQVPLTVSLAEILPVTELGAAPTGDGDVVLSWVDDRNDRSDVEGYEIARGGEVLATVPATARITTDTTAPATGSVTYTVVTVATDGRRSVPTTVSLVLGQTPVPPDEGEESEGGGTGAPTGSTVLERCPFTAEPNVTPADGGIVVSCDGRVAAIVPPGAATSSMFATFVRRAWDDTDGYASLTDLYQLVAVVEGSWTTVDEFDGYVELSFRDLRTQLAEGVPELTTTLRLNDVLADEQAPRVGRETLAVQFVTLGTFRTVEADGRTIRVYGPDPAITPDRFATAAALSQTQFSRAGAAVLARADDYPDALSAAPLAALVGGPVLLTRTGDVPTTTVLELRRLGVTTITLVGGTAAISTAAEQQLVDAGFGVRRIGGDSRFTTSALIAQTVGSVDGSAFLATGQNFADALASSAPAAALGRPILLTTTDSLLDVTADTALDLGIDRMHLVGGTAAMTDEVAVAAGSLGVDVVRSAGATRTETAVVLARDLRADGLVTFRRPIVASGDGDGRTSPDALAAGPIGGREGSILLLTPTGAVPAELDGFLDDADGISGLMMAGGPVAVSDAVRTMIDATG